MEAPDVFADAVRRSCRRKRSEREEMVMRLRKWIIMGACLLGACALANVGCGARGTAPVEDRSQGGAEGALGLEFDYEVNPADFSLTLYVDGQALPAVGASDERRTEQVKTEEDGVSWRYPEEKIRVAVKPEEDYLSVQIGAETEEDQAFRWPEISAGLDYIPLGEGKRAWTGRSWP